MVLGWGRVHRFDQTVTRLSPGDGGERILELLTNQEQTSLAHGMGRSYGDVALNDGQGLIVTPRLNNLISADWETGIVRASAGHTLDDLLQIAVPKGWFPPVMPGTKFVTLGGAVANDVHGKNHHQKGSFGNHVRRFALVRSDQGVIECSPEENTDLFNLTIGGLGLTGVLLWVEIQLTPIRSSVLNVENVTCRSLDDFFRLSQESADWPYTVMWVDCFARGKKLGRGIFTRARLRTDLDFTVHDNKTVEWPVTTPGFLMNRWTISAFNRLYRWRPAARFKGVQHYDPYFFPLDGIRGWNKLYGKNGFYQHQSLIPLEQGEAGVRALLERIGRGQQGSFLAVLKVHGAERSPGVMSFCSPGEGVSLALDFANKGKATLSLLADLDKIVRDHGGRLYPAKDGHMSSDFFQESYPQWERLEEARDPNMSSSFWRRVTQQSGV